MENFALGPDLYTIFISIIIKKSNSEFPKKSTGSGYLSPGDRVLDLD
jgi:hypothetical protein